jgi:hypothetical protein
MRLFQLND